MQHRPAAAHAHAVVHVTDGLEGILRPYQASLLAMHQRLKETGVLQRADHALLICAEGTRGAVSHHEIVVHRMNCTEIDAATADRGFHKYIFYRTALFRLTAYAKVVAIDLDAYIVGDISSIFGYSAPRMVRWESNVAGPFSPNGGVVLVKPDVALYDAAVRHLQRVPVGSKGTARLKHIYNMMTPYGAFHNTTAAVAPDPGPVLANDSDQQFFLMLFNVLERERFGPLQELPYEFNVKHFMLHWHSYRSWTSKAFLTFMSRPEQGHIRLVHFNRDKPWSGAQCGPFHAPFWRAAQRAVAELDAARDGLPASHAGFYAELLGRGKPDSLANYIRDGLYHEEQRPCRKGAMTKESFTKTKVLEKMGTVRSAGGAG